MGNETHEHHSKMAGQQIGSRSFRNECREGDNTVGVSVLLHTRACETTTGVMCGVAMKNVSPKK
jgi:hypothetical protein